MATGRHRAIMRRVLRDQARQAADEAACAIERGGLRDYLCSLEAVEEALATARAASAADRWSAARRVAAIAIEIMADSDSPQAGGALAPCGRRSRRRVAQASGLGVMIS